MGGEQARAVAVFCRVRRGVRHANRQKALPSEGAVRIHPEEGHIFRLHIGHIERSAIRRDGDTLGRDTTSELQVNGSQDVRRGGRILVDAEHFHLVRMQLTDEEKVTLDNHLLRTAAADNLLACLMVAQVNNRPLHSKHRQVALEVHIPIDKLVCGGIKDAESTAEVIKRGGSRGIGHDRGIAEGLAIVQDGHTIDDLWQAMTRLRFVQAVARVMSRDYPPAAGDLDIRRQAAHGESADQRVGIVRHVNDRNGVAEGVSNIERVAVGAQVEIARVGALEVVPPVGTAAIWVKNGPGSILKTRT